MGETTTLRPRALRARHDDVAPLDVQQLVANDRALKPGRERIESRRQCDRRTKRAKRPRPPVAGLQNVARRHANLGFERCGSRRRRDFRRMQAEPREPDDTETSAMQGAISTPAATIRRRAGAGSTGGAVGGGGTAETVKNLFCTRAISVTTAADGGSLRPYGCNTVTARKPTASTAADQL